MRGDGVLARGGQKDPTDEGARGSRKKSYFVPALKSADPQIRPRRLTVPSRPAGLHTMTVNGKTDIWPSWYSDKTSGVSKETLNFNKFNGKLATTCTNPDYVVAIEVTKTTDPMTKKEVYNTPDNYNREEEDDCSYTAPAITASRSGNKISVSVTGSNILNGTYSVAVNGEAAVSSASIPSSTFTPNYIIPSDNEEPLTIIITVTDPLYGATAQSQITVPAQKSSSSDS